MAQHNGRRGSLHLGRQGAVGNVLLFLLLSGCLAQQAELKDVEQSLGKKIKKLDQQTIKLDQQEKDLQLAINRAKVEYDKLVSETRARLSQEISAVREADLPSMQGGLEKTGYQLSQMRSRLDDIDHHEQQLRAGLEASTKRLTSLEKAQSDASATSKADRDRLHDDLTQDMTKLNGRLDALGQRLDTVTTTIGTMAKTLGGRLDEHEKAIHADELKVQQFDVHARQLESQNHSLLEQMAQYKRALDDFKKGLTGLGEKVVQEEQRTNELSSKLLGRADVLTNKVETDTKTTTVHLQDVNRSVGSVAKALETMGGQVMTRVEEQDRRLDDLMRSLTAVDAHVGALTQTVAQLKVEREQMAKSAGSAREETSPQPPLRELTESTEQAIPAPQHGRIASAETVPPPIFAPARGNLAQLRDVYDRHINLFKQGNLDAALQGFAYFLTQYPTSDLAPNAQYWLGECYYGKGDYPRAIEAFNRVKIAYPSSEKVPAALLKKGFAYLALKDRYRASSVWRQVVDGYPRTPEAGKAMEKLAQLKQIR